MTNGKGSKPRPVDLAKYQANYDAIFRHPFRWETRFPEDVAAPTPAPAVLPPVGTAGPAVRTNFIWQGDLGDDCTCRVGDLIAHCECLGEIKWKPNDIARGRFYIGEIWFVCVSRVDANNRTDGPDLFHSGEHGGYVIGAEMARGIAEAIISAALAENCQLKTANSPFMSYQPKPNTWTLFQNTKKRDDMSPDYTGSALLEMPDGKHVEYRLSAWKRVSKNDIKFIGGFIKPKEEQAQPKLLDESAPAAGAGDETPW